MSRLERLAEAAWERFDAFMARPRFKADPETYGPGGFFDDDSYYATMRGMIMFTLFIYVGRHLDSWGQWLWALFGEELYIAPGKALWHARVAMAMGGVPLVIGILKLQRIYATRHRRRAMQAQLEAEIAERLAEQRQQAGLPPTGEPDTETRLREQIRRWPALHDLLWGWPMLLALLMPWLTDPVSALTGIFLGAIAYAINHHYLSKREGRLGLRIALAAAVGLLAVGIWLKFVPAMTGAPVPDARKSTVAPAAAGSNKSQPHPMRDISSQHGSVRHDQ